VLPPCRRTRIDIVCLGRGDSAGCAGRPVPKTLAQWFLKTTGRYVWFIVTGTHSSKPMSKPLPSGRLSPSMVVFENRPQRFADSDRVVYDDRVGDIGSAAHDGDTLLGVEARVRNRRVQDAHAAVGRQIQSCSSRARRIPRE